MRNVQITGILSVVLLVLVWPGKSSRSSRLNEGVLMSAETRQTVVPTTISTQPVNIGDQPIKPVTAKNY